MTARRAPQTRGPARPLRPPKEKDIDTELRQARASRRAEAQQKNRLRRHDWTEEDLEEDDDSADLAIGGGDGNGDDGDDDDDDKDEDSDASR